MKKWRLDKRFPQKLRAARIAAGYVSGSALARELQIDPQRYLTWETGYRTPPLYMLVKLANTLKISPDELLG